MARSLNRRTLRFHLQPTCRLLSRLLEVSVSLPLQHCRILYRCLPYSCHVVTRLDIEWSLITRRRRLSLALVRLLVITPSSLLTIQWSGPLLAGPLLPASGLDNIVP